ncbi:MAG: cytochrome-c peroxidase [Bacteroidales bacterium]
MRSGSPLKASITIILPLAASLFFLLNNCRQTGNGQESYEASLLDQAKVFFRPMPENAFKEGQEASDELIELGKMLYFEPRLSKSGLISCHTCHNLSLSGVDNLPLSIGHLWQNGRRNAPTVLNAALHSTQFHDGREPDVESQALMPIIDPVEMAASEEHVLAVLLSIPEYREFFRRAFPDSDEPISFSNVGVAIGAFERILLTHSRFDQFIRGDLKALNPDELAGLETFMVKGCIACHIRETFGGQTFSRFLTPEEKTGKGDPDFGRFDATGREEDKHLFKVPSLLNVTTTYPYFHDGSEWDLSTAIIEVARSQLGIELTSNETQNLVSFMHALSGEVPGYALELPLLPPSTKTTPLPSME